MPESVAEEALGVVAIEKQLGWAGLLPDPDSFAKYPEYVQRSMVAWNDAQILDDSKRMDRLVDTAAKTVSREGVFTFVLNLVFALLAFAGFIITGSMASYGMLAIPGISIAVNVAQKSRERKAGNEFPPNREE